MWKCLLIGCALSAVAAAQNPPTSFEFANLREDVRGLTQRVAELTARLEQLERENNELRQKASATSAAFATLTQLNQGLSDLERSLKSAMNASKNETLQHVGTQMEKLAKDMNVALDSMAKAQPAARPAASPTFSDNFPKEGISYTVQRGDTLAVIAKKAGAKAQDIVNANKLTAPDRLVPGQTLFVPGGK